MSIQERKSAARQAAFLRRKTAFDAQIPGTAGRLSEVLAGYRGVPMAGYMPIRTEIDPLPAMAEAAAYGTAGLPVVTGGGEALKFAKWEPDCRMIQGAFGAQIPETLSFFVPELLAIPLVAFTSTGMRLGYGGGFYDRTLQKLRSTKPVLAIGFAFDAQETTDLPQEVTDQPLDMVVTESRILTF